ncbi:hypothetical protein [Desulfurispora thermophila]|nr:hypothetical protein [Desulfurispora thermophila]
MSNIPQEFASLIIHRLDRAEEALQNFVKKITEVTYMQIQGGNCL